MLAIEIGIGMGLPMLSSFLVIIPLASFYGAEWPIFCFWLALAVTGWAGLFGFFRLYAIVMGAPHTFNPIVTVSLLASGITAWSIYSYITFFGDSGIFSYIPLITYPVGVHFMYLARAHLGEAFNKSLKRDSAKNAAPLS